MAELSPLRRRMIEDMTVCNLSAATQRSYLHAVSRFSRHFDRSSDRLGLEEVRAVQVHVERPLVAGIEPDGALRFFYGVTLDRGEIPERIPYAREPRKLPVVLSADEVVRFLEAVPSLKTRAALTTAYAAGLRAAEAVALKVADIDSGRMVIRVGHGKGGKDRTVMLSAQLLGIPANILASRSAAALAVSWSGGGEADRRAGARCGVSFGLQGGGPRQAGDGAHG